MLRIDLSLNAVLALLAVAVSCGQPAPPADGAGSGPTATAEPTTYAPEPQEPHLGELHMLTDGGENAEAYFSFAGDALIFQSTRPPFACDQIFTMGVDGSDQRLVSTGKGRTTCAHFYPDGQHILYSSTHLESSD